MNKLLKDAIADAKAVRETALAQAKLALEEAFAPKLQSMLSNKIREEMEEEPKVMSDESIENEAMRMKELAGLYSEEEDEMGGEEELGDEEGMEDMDDEMGDMEDDTEFTIDGQTFTVVPAGEEGGEDLEGDMDDMDDMEDMDADDEELAEILRQLEEEDNLDPNADNYDLDPDLDPMSEAEEKEERDEEINLEELIQALKEGEKEDTTDEVAGDEDYTKASDQAMDTAKGSHGNVVEMKKKMKKMEEEINEAYTAVKFLREKLSEVNLLNAKLLYVNKLFRKNGLTESQKVKIIETFDRAKNVRETKLIYATLCESYNAPAKATNKKTVVENFASAPVKKPAVISEGNDQANRFKKLAGIIKS